MSKQLKKFSKAIQNSFRRNSISESKPRTLKAKLMLSVAAVGTFFMPWTGQEVQAGTITRVGQDTNLMQGTTADIYAQQVKNDVGLNRFTDFKVNANEIANLHFLDEATKTQTLNSLVNTVQNQINIAGTVNAIRNNQIGGNLYFLSPGGMVITGSGAVNAGALNVMTPTKDLMEKLTSPDLLTGEGYDVLAKNIPLNQNGTISIHGKINAQTGINLLAGKDISITKDGSGSPMLRTGVVFDNVVNAGKFVSASVKEGERMQIATDSSGNLVLTDASGNLTGDGSINIKAYADSTNFSGYDPKIDFLSLGDTAAKATVTVDNTAEINALGKASISSEAKFNKTINATLNFLNNMNFNILRSDTYANTTVDGMVSGSQVDITSKASSTTNLANESDIIDLVKKELGELVLDKIIGTAKTDMLKNILSNQIRATTGFSTSEATTKLGENAVVHAYKRTGVTNSGDVNISAASSANYKVNIAMHPFEDTASLSSKSIFNAGFLLSDVTSKATVDIAKNKNLDNSIIADKNLNITSSATNKMTSALKVGAGDYISKILGDKSYSFLNIGVGITNQTTESTINMGTNVKAEGAANIAAKESVSLGTSAGTSNKPTGALSSGILIVDADNTVKNNISGNITAKSVNISSDLKIDKLQAISSDTIGAFNGIKTKLETYLISKIPYKDEIAGVAQGIFKSTIADGKLADIIKSTEGLAKLFSAGASVLTVGLDNTVETNIKEGSVITANSGDLNVLANADITSSRFHVKSAGNDIGDKRAAVFVAVGVNNIKNNISVNVEKNAQLKATNGNVNIKATDDNHFDNLNKAITDVFEILQSFDFYRTKLLADSHLTAAEKAKLQELYEAAFTSSKEITADLLLVPWKGGEKYEAYINYMQEMVAKYKVQEPTYGDLEVALLTSKTEVMELWDHLDFTTFFVYADARQKDESKMAGFGLTGAVGVHNVENISSVNIGENVKITAQGTDDKGNVNISANTLAGEFAFGGRFELLPCFSDGSKVGMGGTAVISDLVTESKVKINDGVQIDASKAITVETDNEAIHQMGGTAGNNGKDFALTGLVTKLGGSSKGTVEISDQTIFSAGDAINLKSNNKNILTNLVGEKVESESASVGVSVSQIAYDIDSIVTVGTINNLNTAFTNNSLGTWTANILDVNALNSGVINSLAIAGVKSADPVVDDPNKPGLIKALWNRLFGPKQVNEEAMIEMVEIPPLLPEGDDPGAGGDAEEGHGEEQNADVNQGQQNNSKIKVSLAGSVAYNNIKENTKAEVHNITLNKPEAATKDNSHVNISAEDSLFIGAYSGSAALTRSGTEADSNKFSATLAGAVALNDVNKTTKALVDNATITTAGDFTNKAYNHGTQLAAGLGLGIEQGNRSSGIGFDFTASGSQNEVINTISAELNNATITSNASIGNIAYANDTQIAGGISFDYAKTSLGLGATVTVQDVSNQIEAKISGGNLKADAGISNLAADKLLQVGGAVSIGVTPKTESKTYVSGNAAVSVNRVINHTKSIVDGGASLTAGKISLEAYDKELDSETLKLVPVADTQTLTEKAEAADRANENQETAEDTKPIFKINSSNEEEINKLKDLKDTKGSKVFDLTGQGFEEKAKSGGDVSLSVDDAKEERTYKDGGNFGIENNGSRIIGGALSLSANMGDTSGATFGAGLTYNDVINSFTSNVSGANLTVTDASKSLDVKAMSDTLVIGSGIGVAAKSGTEIKGFSAAGSGALSRSVATTKATIENSTIKSDTVNVNALTKSVLISAAGQGSGTNANAALGMTWAQNKLENTTGAYVYSGTLDGKDHDLTLNLLAENQSKNYAIAAGVGASIGSDGFKATATGAYAANTGRNNTEAIIDGYKDSEGKLTKATIGKDKKAQAINVNAQDKTTLKAISGNVTVAAGSASTALTFGGTVVNNNVGSENKKQNVLAQINNASIKTTDAANINVKADNRAELLSVAVGGALSASSGFSLGATGSVAIDNIHTLTDASMTDTDINSDSAKAGNVNLDAISHTNITTSADDLNIVASTGGVPITAMGVVSKVNSDADTSAGIYGKKSTQNVKTEIVKADSKNNITDVAIGVNISGSSGGFAGAVMGNVAANNINNDIKAEVKNANISADDLGVLAVSEETIKNYGGSIGVSVSNVSAASFGATVVLNKITGETTSLVDSSIIKTSGGEGIDIKKYALDSDAATEEKVKGLVVNADANHNLRDITLTLGIAGSANSSFSVNATVAENTIAGGTRAQVLSSAVDSSAADVSIRAHDLTDVNSFVGTLSGAGAATSGFGGAGSGDHNDFSRTVIAEFDGGSTVKNLKAKAIDINALNKAKLTLMESGLGIGGGEVGIGATGVVSVDNFAGETYAVLNHGDVTISGSVSVEADSKKDVGVYTNAASASGGYIAGTVTAAVGVVKENSKTIASIENSLINTKENSGSPEVNLKANNLNNITTAATEVGAAIGLGGAVGTTVSVNNFRNAVATNLINSQLGAENNSLEKFTSFANNTIHEKFYNNSIGGGLATVGVGVGVNTIDSGVLNNITDSKVYAKAIDLKAEELRDIKELAISAGIGAGSIQTSVMVNNIGATIEDEHKDPNNEKANYSLKGIQNKTESAYKEVGLTNNKLAEGKFTKDVTSSREYEYDKGGNAEGVQTKLAGSQLVATGTDENDGLNIKSLATTNTDVKLGQGTAAVGAINVTVASTTVHQKTGVDISGSTLEANKIDVQSENAGELKQKAIHGEVAGGSINVVVSTLENNGSNKISLREGSTITAGRKLADKNDAINSSLNILASDHMLLNNHTTGVEGGVANIGALFTRSYDYVNTGVDISGGVTLENKNTLAEENIYKTEDKRITKLNGEVINDGTKSSEEYAYKTNKPVYGAVKVAASNKNVVKAKTNVVQVGLINADGAVSTARIGDGKDKGITSVNLTGSNNLRGSKVELGASNEATAKAEVFTVPVDLVGITNASATAENNSQAKTTVSGQNFVADEVNLSAYTSAIGTFNREQGIFNISTHSAEATVKGGAGNAVLGIGINTAKAISNNKSELTVENNSFKKSTWADTKAEDVLTADKKQIKEIDVTTAHEELVEGQTKLSLENYTMGTEKVDASVVDVTLGVGLGFNRAITENNSETTLNFNPGTFKGENLSLEAYNADYSKNTADGNGGSSIDVSPTAADAKHTNTSKTTVNISGDIKTSGDFSALGANYVQSEMYADAIRAKIAGGSGVIVDNIINSTATVNLNNAKVKADGSVSVGTYNTAVFNKETDKAVKGNGFGGFDATCSYVTNDITTNGNTNLLGSTSIISNGEQNYYADTDTDIKSAIYVLSGAIIADSSAINKLSLTSNNTVNLAKAAHLATKDEASDITLAANDQHKLVITSLAESMGLVNFATVAKNYNTVNRNNTINVEGNISSLHDVNLFAGKGINGELGLMDLYSTAEAYSKSAIPVSGAQPHIYNEFNQTNTVNVKPTGVITSVRNANLYADAGKEITELFCRTFTGWGSKGESEYVATTNGKISYNEKAGSVKGKTARNTVQIDGSVTAGTANYQNYHFGFKDRTDMVVLTSEEQYQAVMDYLAAHSISDRDKYVLLVEEDKKGQEDYYRTIDEIISITDKDGKPVEGLQITAKDFKIGTRDYGISILSRMNQLADLMKSYADHQESAAYQGYKAEYDTLYQRLEDAGCLTEDGNLKSIVVNYVEVPDLIAHGGNVNVTTDNFYSNTGAGKVTAKGTPSVNIVNDTNLAMNINDISVADAGGQIFYNEKALNPGTDTSVEKINEALAKEISQANKDHAKTINKAYAATGSAGEINIKGNNQLAKYGIYYEYTDADGKEQIINETQPVKADIFINGTVSAPDGIINIESAKNDIIIEGKNAGDNNALVTAKTVNLIADGGSINQGYVDNIVNIGGDPRDQYGSPKDNLQANAVNKISTTVIIGQGATVAGGNVVINAADINVNGTIQSGYEKFYVDIKPDYELDKSDFDPSQTGTITVDARMKEIAEYNAGKAITDTNVVGNPAYMLIKGMAVKRTDDSNIYDYRVGVYYNPATNRIIVSDVESKGGHVSLTGNIASTGGGQINCLDGASDISVKNSIDKELVVGNLITNDVTGIIRITDTNRLVEVGDKKVAKVSEYSRDDAGDVWVSYNGGEKTKLTGDDITYTPKEGIRYSWTEGTTSSTKETYRKTWYNKWWGASSTQSGFKEDLLDNSTTSTQIGERTELGSDPKAQGEFIGVAQGKYQPEDVFDVVYEQTKNGEPQVVVTNTRKWSQGYLNCHKYTEITWDKIESGTVDTYTYSVKADQPFKLNFIGKADGVSQVDVSTSKNNILLTGDIGNRKLYEVKDASEQITGYEEKGSVNLRADFGSIKRVGGSIYGNDVDVLAMGNVEDLDVTAGDNMNLAVKNISAIIDGDASIRPTSEVEQNISVTAHSNGLAAGNLTISKAGAVDLEYSTSGTGETIITETQTANTNVIDLVNKGRVGNITTTSDGLIAASRINLTSANGSINANVRAAGETINTDPLSASVNANAQGNITLTQKKLASDASDSNYDLRLGTIYSEAGDVTINVPDGSVIDALPYEDLSQAAKNTLIEKWLANGLIDDPEASAEAQAKSKALQDEKAEALDETYTPWSKDALLYSIQNSIINQKSEDLPKTSSKAPNVRGNNITLNVKDSAGLLDENIIQMKVSTLGDANKESINKGTGLDDLKLLSQTDPSNVIWDTDKDLITITNKLPIGVQLNTPGQDEEGKHLPLGLIKVANFTKATPQVKGDIFLEGRIDPKAEPGSDLNKDLKIGKLSAAGDISVTSLGKILGLENTEDAYIIGKSLNITAADGTIGEQNNPLLTDIFGGEDSLGLRAIAPGGIYIKDVGEYDAAKDNALWLNHISSAGDIEISADKSIYQLTNNSDIPYNIVNETPDTKLTLISYEGSVGQAITNADGSIKYDEEGFPILTTYEEEVEGKIVKKQSKAIHVKNGASNVTVKAAKNIYVEGISSAEAGSEPQGTLNLNAGSVDPAKNLENFGVYVNGTLNLADETSSKISADNLISLDTAKTLNLNKELEAKDVKLRSKEDIVTNAAITAKNDALLTAGTDLLVNSDVTAKNAKLSAENDVNVSGKVQADETAELTAKHDALVSGEVKAKNAKLSAENDINVNADAIVYADETADLKAKENVIVNGSVKSADKINITSLNKSISLADNNALVQGANINLTAKENITEVYDNAQNIGASIVTNYVEDGVTKQGTLTTNNSGALDLGSKNNKLGIVNINNTSENTEDIIKLGNSGSKDLEVTIKNDAATDKKVAGSVEVYNYDTEAEAAYNNIYVNQIYAQGDLSITNEESYDEDTTKHFGIYIGKIPEYHAATDYKEYPGVIDVDGQIDLIAKGTVNNEQLGKDKSDNPVAGGSITAGKDINIKAQVFSNGEGAQIISKSGSLNAEVTGADIEKVKFAEVERKYVASYNRGAIYTDKDINITTTNEKGSIANFGILQAGNDNSEGSIILTSKNDLYLVEPQTSSTGIDDSNVWASKEIIIDVTNNMLEYGALWAKGGNVNITVGKDAIISGDYDPTSYAGNCIYADDSVNINVGNNIINQNLIVANKGDIKIQADGSVLNAKHGDKYIIPGKENPLLVKDVINEALEKLGFKYKLEDKDTSNGIIDARNGRVYIEAGSSEKVDGALVVNNSTVYAKDNIYVTSRTGDVANGGDFVVDKGDITLEAAKRIANLGYMKVGGTGTAVEAASGNVSMIAGEDLVNYGVVESPEGDILLTVTNDGIIYNAEQADFLTKGNIIILNQTKDQDKLYRFDIDLPENPTLMELYEAKKVKSETGKYLNGSVTNKGDLLANQGTIRIKSNAADVYNYDDFDSFTRKEDPDKYLYEYNGIVISTGSIELLAPKGEVLNTKDLVATGDPTSEKFNAYVLIEADKDLANYAYNILADKDITLISHSGNIINSAVLQSTSGDVTLNAENGSVANTKEGWVDGTSRRNENGGDIIALNGQVHLLAGGSSQEKITVEGKEYKSGSVINNGDMVSLGETGLIHLRSEQGDVINTTDLQKLHNSQGEEIANNIYKALAGTNAGKGGAIDPNYDKAINGYLISTNDITLEAPKGAIYNSKELLVALGNVTMEAAEGMDSFGDTIYAGKDINLIANKGDLVNNAKLISIEGNINLTSKEGSVVNMLNADIEALGTGEDQGNVNLKAGGNTTEGKDLSVKFVDTNGNKGKIVKVTIDPETQAEKREEINTGNILVAHKFYKSDKTGEYVQVDDTTNISGLSSSEQASLVTVLGFISDNGEVIYSEDYKAEDAQGKILPSTTITYEGQTLIGVQKDIEAYRMGDVINRGDIIAQGSKGVQLVSEHSNVSNYDNFSIVDGLVNEKGERYYEENIADKFNAGTKYNDEKYNKGIISVGDIALHADEGYIYNNMDIITEGNVDITSEKALTSGLNFGRIEAGKNVNISSKENVNLIGKASPEEIVNILSKNGIVSIASENGNIHAENFTIEANSKATEPSPNGSIVLTSTNGNINFVNGNLFANGNADGKGGTITAAVGVGAEGTPTDSQKIILGEIGSGKELKANQIIVLNENVLSDSEIKLGDITVNNFLVIEGQQAEVGKISREKQDVFDTLNVAVTGAQGGTMQSPINLETPGDTRYHALNVTDANVSTTDGGKLEIDKLHTQGKVQADALGFTTSIYGKAPDTDDNSATIYFDLTDGSGVGFDLEGKEGLAFSRESRYPVVDILTDSLLNSASTPTMEAHKDGSFYLNTFAPDYQESNGLLLHRTPFYYVKNQRFSLEDLSRKLEDTNSLTAFHENHANEISLYNRHNLYKLADGFVEGIYDAMYVETEEQDDKK